MIQRIALCTGIQLVESQLVSAVTYSDSEGIQCRRKRISQLVANLNPMVVDPSTGNHGCIKRSNAFLPKETGQNVADPTT
jgi:hypothetical protein